MGRESQAKQERKQEVIHRTRLFGGQSAEDFYHSMHNKRCQQCGAKAVMRAITFAPLAELHQRSPEFLIQLAQENQGTIPMVDFTTGKFVRVGEAWACGACRKDLQRQAAKAPSWCQVEFHDGPGPDNPVVAVPR